MSTVSASAPAFASRPLGRSGLAVSELGFGTGPLGELFERMSNEHAQRTLEAGWAAGLRYFDTAPYYGHGQSEHRTGAFLREMPRSSFTLSTKVGRVLTAAPDENHFDRGPWSGPLPFVARFDYSRDGILRSYEDSLQRMGVNRVDALIIHDLDFGFHRTEEGVTAQLRQLFDSGWKALAELKASGAVRAIGAGINELGMIPRFLDALPLDFFLVAHPYTLLDQDVLNVEFPRCQQAGAGVIVGAPFASGILVTGATPKAMYRYEPAPSAVRSRVAAISAVCQRHGVPLAAAALQFPLAHPLVASVIPGMTRPEHVSFAVEAIRHPIPNALWAELKHLELLRADAPTPRFDERAA